MIRKNKILFVSIALCLLFSCRKDKPENVSQPGILIGPNGVFITNEGNFQFGNAQVSYYDPSQTTATQDLFQPANNRPLGDICQSMCLLNGKIYLVINNSNKIEVVNENTFVSSSVITGFTSPRYFLPVSNSKAYVTDLNSNSISIVDLSNNIITGNIPCNGWTEELALVYGKAYVTNKVSNKIYVINTSTDILTDSITIGYGSNSIVEDTNGKLWVLCGGNQSMAISASLHRINPATNIVEQTYTFSNSVDAPRKLHINGTNDTLYYLNGGIYRMSVHSGLLPTSPFIQPGSNNFYGLGIDPNSSIVYVADAVDYLQRGVIYRYQPDGTLINTFRAGIIPGDFYFK